MDLRGKINKLEKQACAMGDNGWRERVARDHAKSWIENVEPLFCKIYNTKPKAFDEVFQDEMRQLEAFPSEAACMERMNTLKSYLADIEKEINFRARFAGNARVESVRQMALLPPWIN